MGDEVSKVPGKDGCRGPPKSTPRLSDSQEDPQAQHIIILVTMIYYIVRIRSKISKGKRCVGQSQ